MTRSEAGLSLEQWLSRPCDECGERKWVVQEVSVAPRQVTLRCLHCGYRIYAARYHSADGSTGDAGRLA